MQINYLGHSCFKIRSKNTILLTDPFDESIGFPLPRTKADIVTISHEHKDHFCLDNVEGEPFIVNGPGEYEIADVSVFGLAAFHDKVGGAERGKNTIYTIRTEEVSLCHLGDLGHKLNDQQLEEVNGVDVLFIPVGGTYTLGPKEAVEVINQVEPKIVIPMHYRVPALESSFAQSLLPLEDFLNEIGVPEAKSVDKLIVSKTNLPEEREVVSLNPKR